MIAGTDNENAINTQNAAAASTRRSNNNQNFHADHDMYKKYYQCHFFLE